MGEHTDYNGGPVLSVAVQRRVSVAAEPAAEWALVSGIDPEVRRVDVNGPPARGWTEYLVGVARELRALGVALPGARLAVGSTLPISAGLSSSAALTVAAAKALSLLAGRRLTPSQLAEVAFRAESGLTGVRCERADQTIAAHAERRMALLFETATGGVKRVAAPDRLWLVETGIPQPPGGGELEARRRECAEALAYCRDWRPGLRHLAQLATGDLPEVERRLPPPLVPRVRYVVSEVARTRTATAALAAGNREVLGRLMVEAHESLRVDYQSTVAEADFLVESAVSRGAYGARLIGAGWGGAVVVLAPPPHEARILAEIGGDFREQFGRVPDVWNTRASVGVRREAVPV